MSPAELRETMAAYEKSCGVPQEVLAAAHETTTIRHTHSRWRHQASNVGPKVPFASGPHQRPWSVQEITGWEVRHAHGPPHNRTGPPSACAADRQMLLARLPPEQLIAARAAIGRLVDIRKGG